ncbi:Ldh family oxidoreductase [Kaistia dalseonensis]|uniref:LDH2 family malate/lactate/ureidoglycolate dehydrogenase n=1 Tax=Kaistia dalseonensis TaxID=410840 RepID=A0ABU0HA96_9HYPH|nr:Ldh family oxidoreductase [Kaistia dalseonensis]MCX5496613.1 Ldh family oxidoreductase [Kaistia dalseonensis]MDQ0439236.1 LDH2 family malate/lactate/ureidoglycolate dehydrogenase [Kaistia dalseonensis]
MAEAELSKLGHDVRGRASAETLSAFVESVLRAAGTETGHARSVASALTEASLRGVDSHGVRLAVHYAKVVRTGRINPNPQLKVDRTGPGTAILDADNGFGHHASFAAIDEGVALAAETGIAAVSVINSSHFGAAGCYSLRAAASGYVGFAFANSDSFVLAHDSVEPFHGTNPISFAAPVAGERPFLLDMATSTVPWNRVQDMMAKGLTLPNDVAVDSSGAITRQPAEAAALLPIGGLHFGFKGAALASMLEILSAVMTGSPHCTELLGMVGPDWSTPRRLGHFFIVIDPARFVPRPLYDAAMAAYLADIRAARARPGTSVMAPGDREWKVERERSANGIPVAEALAIAFDNLAAELAVPPLAYL